MIDRCICCEVQNASVFFQAKSNGPVRLSLMHYDFVEEQRNPFKSRNAVLLRAAAQLKFAIEEFDQLGLSEHGDDRALVPEHR
jgi:hypothetical protein